MPEAGLEPARPNGQGILSPSCLPIPPPGHKMHGKTPLIINTTIMERETRFELATPTLARLCSTPEPLPHNWSVIIYNITLNKNKTKAIYVNLSILFLLLQNK